VIHSIDYFRKEFEKMKKPSSEKNEKIGIRFSDIDLLKKICNVLYGVNELEINSKDSMDFLLFAINPVDNSSNFFQSYTNENCYDATKFPWHFEATNVLCQMMASKIDTYSLEEKVELATKFKKFLDIKPVKELMALAFMQKDAEKRLAITTLNNNDQLLTKRTEN
jgi:hypothetical protein